MKQTSTLKNVSIQKYFLLLLTILGLSFTAFAQTIVSNETFPNQFNTSFGTTNNSNGTFVGSAGTWTASCNSNALSAIAVIPAYYSAVTNAIKIVNWNTSGVGAADCHAASPGVNLSSYSCAQTLNLTFQLYTYTCNSADPNSFFKVEFSADNGTTWTSVWSMSSAQIFAAYGTNGLTNISVPVGAAYRVSGFKYRFSGYKPANESHNFYLFVDDAKITATACSTCNSKVTSLYFNELSGGTDLPITNGSSFTVAQLGSLYNMEAATTGTIGSVKYTITGPTPTSNIENTAPYNNPGTGSGAWTGAVGTYNVNLKTYSAADGTGTLCHDTTISFNLSNTTYNCNCTGTNVVLNPGFENGITSWSSAGGSLAAGTGGIACGSFSGDLNNTSTTSKAWQTIGTDLPAGTTINVSVYAGTHDNTFNNYVAVEFLDASNVVLGTSLYTQVDKILANAPAGPQLYSFSATVPSGAKYTRVAFGGTGSYTKTDQWCVTTTPPANTGSIGDRVWLDADGDGIQDASETGGITGITVQLKNSAGTVIATTTTNASGNYLFSGLAAGNYTVVFPASVSGAIVTAQNVGADDNIDSDASQTTGATGTIALAASQNITNVDAGYCPVNLQLGNRVWYDTNNDGINNSENGIANITLNLYKDDNNDNVADGALLATVITDANGYYSFNNLAPGNYIVGAVNPNGYVSSTVNGGDPDNDINIDDNGQVTVGNETRGLAITLIAGTEYDGTNTNTNNNITYDFGFLPDCNCTTGASNLLVNGNFENGTTGWSWNASNGSLTTGTGYIACGAANGFNNWAAGTSIVYQDVATAPGAVVTFKGFAGTHTPGLTCSPKLSIVFLNASNAVLGQSDAIITRDVDVNFGQLQQYTLVGTAPAGTTKVRVQSSITCNTVKMDAFCLTIVNPTFTLGNTVWYDKNNNGNLDAGEAGISGVVVKLYDCSGTYLNKTATTDASGNYQFTSLSAGSYIAGITTPAGYAKSDVGATNVGTDNQNDGTAIVTTEIRTACFTTTGSTNNIDFGLKGSGFIGDFVWNDVNGNGIQDGTELGISGVTVTLTYPDATTVTTASDANGLYSFVNLAPGTTYSVAFTTLAGYTPTGSNLGGDDTKDSDPVAGSVTGITVSGNSNTTIDAGFYKAVNVGNIVWNDKNNNGTKESTETGIGSVVVNLYLDANNDNVADGASIASTNTDANGIYNFGGLAPNNYIVGVTIPSGYAVVTIIGGDPDNNTDNDNNGTNTSVAGEVRSSAVTLTSGGEPDVAVDTDGLNGNLTVDFGFKGTGSLGDFVWNDVNGNGIQDGGELGKSGVTVTLIYPDASIATTLTDANGLYSFVNLAPGTTYGIAFTTPAGYLISPSNAGGDDTKDSDPVGGSVTGISVNNNSNTTIDAGFYLCTLSSGINGPSTICANEPALFTPTPAGSGSVYNWTFMSGIPATGTGSSVSSQWNTPGEYDITLNVSKNGCTASYTKSIIITPAVFAFAGPDSEVCSGGSTTLDGDAPTGANYSWTVESGDPTSIDNGANQEKVLVSPLVTTTYKLTVTQNGCTRTDQVTITINVNKNPVADAGPAKTIVAGTTVVIGGNPTGTPPVDMPSAPLAYSWTPVAGLNNATLANPSVTITTPGTYSYQVIVYNTITGCSDTSVTTVNVQQGVNLGNLVYYDKNDNGSLDLGEGGIKQVTVNLYADANNDNVADGAPISSTTTSNSGIYNFNNLLAGNYIVGVIIPDGYAVVTTNGGDPDNDINNDNNGTNTSVAGEVRSNAVTLSVGGEPLTGVDGDGNNGNLTIDFALKGTGSLGDLLQKHVNGFKDANGNGLQESGESKFGGITVILTYPDLTTATSSTNADGSYAFKNLEPGIYSLEFITPSGYIASPSNVGINDDIDSDPVNGKVTGIVLAPGQANVSIDAGFYQLVNVGNLVWNDQNNNGIKESTESGIGGVTVKLYVDSDNNNVADGAAINSVLTDANGLYNFIDLTPANYIVGVSIPSGYSVVTTNGGDPDNDIDNDNNGTNTSVAGEVRSSAVTLSTGFEPNTPVDGDSTNGNLTVDFAFKPNGGIGNFVWNDINRNGLQDAGEPGIQGVAVTLTFPDASTRTINTDANGAYNFTELAAGTYSVSFATPVSYLVTNPNIGTNDSTDSDPVSGVVSNIVLADGEINNTIDAGFIKLVTISGNVWHDVNALTDNLVNNSGALQNPVAAPIPVGMRAYLVNNTTGVIVKIANVPSSTGAFTFSNVVSNTNYFIILSSNTGFIGSVPPLTKLALGWINVGEKLGITLGSDGVANGRLNVPVLQSNVINANFGVKLSTGASKQ